MLGFSTKPKWQTSNDQYFLYFSATNLLLVSIDWKCYKDLKILNLQFPKCQLPEGKVRSTQALQTTKVAERLGSCRVGKYEPSVQLSSYLPENRK